MRLNAYLARAGVASRRGADELIKAGRVTVDGAPGELNTFVETANVVRVDGREVGKQALRHILLNKPRGTIATARDPEGRPTVVDLVGGDVRVVPVGRLDRDTTGVLLLTNDGPLAHRLAHPRYGVEKTYVAEVQGEPGGDVLQRLAEGIDLDDGPTAPARVTLLGPSRLELVLHEGRNRQVRRMLEAVGHPVVTLRRSRNAGLSPGRLRPGDWRELTRDEVRRLRRLVGLAFDLRDVRLLDPVARMGEPVRERAVVRQQQHARRVAVEASHRNDADIATDEVDDRRPALRIARGRDRPTRLVEQDVAQRLLADLAAVDPDDVPRLDERVQLAGRAVDRDPAGLDQPVGAASRGDTGPGEIGVQPHEAILRR